MSDGGIMERLTALADAARDVMENLMDSGAMEEAEAWAVDEFLHAYETQETCLLATETLRRLMPTGVESRHD